MTLEQILALRRDKLCEFDAMVAERVFGLGRDVRVAGETNKVRVWTANPAIDDGVWTADQLRTYGAPYCYHSDPTADMDVHRAACAWDVERQRRYFDCLEAVLSSRNPELKPHYRGLGLVRWYEVGDYAAAALATLEESA